MCDRKSLHETRPKALARVMAIAEDSAPAWSTEELTAVLTHQLDVSLETDLRRHDRNIEQKLERYRAALKTPLTSFADLLSHHDPPLELLVMTKNFAKANRQQAERGFPPEVAMVLYFAAIAAAVGRCREHITTLSNNDLRVGFEWCRSQSWVNAWLVSLFSQGLNALEGA